MEAKIIKEKENPLFNRNEIILEINSLTSPKNEEVLELISKKFSTPPEQIKVKGIYGKFGTNTFTIYGNVYKTVLDKEKTETKTKREREAEKKALEEAKKAEEERKKTEAETKVAEENKSEEKEE
jgi:ribosomal protein S24E